MQRWDELCIPYTMWSAPIKGMRKNRILQRKKGRREKKGIHSLGCSGREWGSQGLAEICKDQNETKCRGPSPMAWLRSTAKYENSRGGFNLASMSIVSPLLSLILCFFTFLSFLLIFSYITLYRPMERENRTIRAWVQEMDEKKDILKGHNEQRKKATKIVHSSLGKCGFFVCSYIMNGGRSWFLNQLAIVMESFNIIYDTAATLLNLFVFFIPIYPNNNRLTSCGLFEILRLCDITLAI